MLKLVVRKFLGRL